MTYRLLFLLLIPFLLIPVYATEDDPIPSWIKVLADAWVDDDLNDHEFKEAIKFLIEKNIIVIDSPQPVAVTIDDSEKRIFKLELAQKDDMVSKLQDELEELKSKHSKTVDSLKEEQDYAEQMKADLKQAWSDFEQYKKEYPLKVGNIGGETVSAETVKRLTAELADLRASYEELSREHDRLERELRRK